MGIGINLSYIFLLLFFCYRRFKRYIFPREEKGLTVVGSDVALAKGELVRWDIACENFRNQLLNFFSGVRSRLPFDITIDGKSIVTGGRKDFVIIPHFSAIPPEIMLKDLASLTPGASLQEWLESGKKRFGELEPFEKLKFLVSMVEPGSHQIYILENPLRGHRDQYEIRDFIMSLRDGKRLVIELISEPTGMTTTKRFILTYRSGSTYKTRFPNK